MFRLLVASGLCVLEAATHLAYAGTHTKLGLAGVVLPALVATMPAICRTANEWFQVLTECDNGSAA